MKLSIELFLLDNLLMNYLVLKLASVLCGKRLRALPALAVCLLGAVAALLSMSSAPVLQTPPAKLLLGLLMALPLKRSWKRYYAAVLYLFIASFFMGGLMLVLSMVFGGGMSSGALIGTLSLRILLLSLAACAAAPRVARALVAVVLTRKKRVRMLVSLPDRTLELVALLDSGNLLTEPLSGLPVVVVKPGLLPEGGRPVPYRTMDSTGFVYAIRPISLQVDYGGWLEIDAFLAESPMPLDGADAIIDSALLTQGGICTDAEPSDEQNSGAVPAANRQANKTDLVHPFGRDAAAAVPGGGRAGVDQSIDAG